MKAIQLIVLLLVVFSFALSIAVYEHMPDPMVSHWDASGQPDDVMDRNWALFLVPALLVFVVALLLAAPYIDPLKENIKDFRIYFDGFILVICVFFLFVQFHMISWNGGIRITPNRTFPIAIGILFFYIGVLCQHAKQNWFIGIRTPWTLSSKKVWKDIHEIGALLFKFLGILTVISTLLDEVVFYVVIGFAIAVALFLFVYSYVLYNQYKKK